MNAEPQKLEPPVFLHEPLRDVLDHLEAQISAGASTVQLRVPNPSDSAGAYPGELVGTPPRRHRPLRLWADLADRLCMRLAVRWADEAWLELSFTPLDTCRPLLDRAAPRRGKYAPGRGFERVCKLEEPGFVLDMRDALQRVRLDGHATVLSLGVNSGDELELVFDACPGAAVTGVDHDPEALAGARTRFPPPHRFVEADLNSLPALGRFDLVLCVDTLQSPRVDDRAVLRTIVQRLLAPRGSVILGLPNGRYLDGELLYGARMVNYRQPELALLVKTMAFYKKYLQQHRRRVFITGKHEALLTAVPVRSGREPPAPPGG